MKINWGTGIFLFYMTFVGALAFQLFKSFQYDNSLVVNNYYEKDIHYQEQYDKLENSQSLNEPLIIENNQITQKLVFTFPKETSNISGEVWLYRANDKSKDLHLPITTDENNTFEIFTSELSHGEWTISVDWKSNDKAFFDEKVVQISSAPLSDLED